MQGKYAEELQNGDSVKVTHYDQPAIALVEDVELQSHRVILSVRVNSVKETLSVPHDAWAEFPAGVEV
ncbi:hypothetical protein ACQ4M3_00925 [Leptolyngbya sp. AN03gr2]|uniref:hypothetical protein n=1 Tax=unclassified Leptolyngbya TaxID=2650499 RepID=UPI003D324020